MLWIVYEVFSFVDVVFDGGDVVLWCVIYKLLVEVLVLVE